MQPGNVLTYLSAARVLVLWSCGLDEGPLLRKKIPANLPNHGSCWIRPIRNEFIEYLGKMGRTVNEQRNELPHTLRQPGLMPQNDSHSVAPGSV